MQLQPIGAALGQYLLLLPLIIVWIVGIVIALTSWQKHPQISLYAVIGLGLLLLRGLVVTGVNVWLPISMYRRGMDVTRIGVISTVVGVVSALVASVGWVLILLAIFRYRNGHREVATEEVV
ncbi:MAG: hypothetical protein ACLFU8_12100 [Anaerolineales bacterium]